MPSTHRVVLPLRVLLVLLFAAVVIAQGFALPGALWRMAEESPDLASLRWPLLMTGVLALVCVQVVLVCTWVLLTMVTDDRIFSDASSTWVDAIVRAVVAASAVLLAGFGYASLGGGGAGLSALLLASSLVAGALGLLVVVMRALLRQATTLRTDMEEVI